MVLENIEEVGTGNSLLSEALLSLDEINSSKCIPIGDDVITRRIVRCHSLKVRKLLTARFSHYPARGLAAPISDGISLI